jgi:hypothetical protein
MTQKVKRPKSITIFGRRWFRRGPGGTYCSAEIIVDGKPVAKVGPSYSSGEYYLQLARDWLEANGYLPGLGRDPLRRYCQDRKIAFSYSAADVSRERDL